MTKNTEVREPIATWWKISRYAPSIESLHVVSFTASFVTYLEKSWNMSDDGDKFRERRERRDDIFPTFDEAKQMMLHRAQRKLKADEESLRESRYFLEKVESLKEPK